MARARGVRSQLAVAFEDTEKTAPASGYFVAPHMRTTLGYSQELLEDEILGTRDPLDHYLDSPVVDGDIEVPVDPYAFGMWLKALLGAPSTSEDTGVYTHVYNSGAWTALPTLAIEKQAPDVPSFEMLTGVKVGTLNYSMQRQGRVNATLGLIGQGSSVAASTAAGSPASFTRGHFMQTQGSITIDGSDVGDVVSADITYSSGLDPVETITSDGFIAGLDEMRAACSGTMRVRFSSEALFTTARAGTPVALVMTHSIGADLSLTMSLPRVFLSVPKRPVEGAAGIEASFDWQASRDDDGSAMLTATLINNVASY
jgi:hypothetical protein